MSHQPFEKWIIDSEPLQPQESLELETHLRSCVDCSQLQGSWHEVQNLFESVPLVEPGEGFIHRWRERLEQNQFEQHVALQRRNIWIFILLSGIAALVVFILLIMQIWQTEVLPTGFILVSARLLTITLTMVNTTQYAINSLVKILITLIPPVWWVAMMIIVSALSVLWIVSLRRIWSPRRITQ